MPKLSRHESRRALLKAGHELLYEVGLSDGLDYITLSAAATRAGVPRASAHRLFDRGEFTRSEAFRRDLMVELASTGRQMLLNLLADPIRHAVEQPPTINARRSDEGLTVLLGEAIQAASRALAGAGAANIEIATYCALLAGGDKDIELHPVEAVVGDSLRLYGLVPLESWSFDTITESMLSTIVGSDLSSRVSRRHHDLKVHVGPASGEEAWTPLALTLLGILSLTTEPVSNDRACAKPKLWFLG